MGQQQLGFATATAFVRQRENKQKAGSSAGYCGFSSPKHGVRLAPPQRPIAQTAWRRFGRCPHYRKGVKWLACGG